MSSIIFNVVISVSIYGTAGMQNGFNDSSPYSYALGGNSHFGHVTCFGQQTANIILAETNMLDIETCPLLLLLGTLQSLPRK